MEIETIDNAPCPDCKRPMIWHNINQQWYCQKCELYHQPGPNSPRSTMDHISEEFDNLMGDKTQFRPPIYNCKRCSTPLNWIPERGRWYCYTCRNYL